MRNQTNRLLFLTLLLLGTVQFLLAASGSPSEVDRRADWRLQTGVVLGVNPTVFGISARAGYSIPLFDRYARQNDTAGVLWQTARVEPGVDILANPSFTDIALRLYVEPIAFFDLRIETGVRTHYTTFGYGLTPLEAYSEDLPAVTGDDYDRRSEWGQFVRVVPRLKAAVGPVIATNTTTAAWYTYPNTDAAYLEESVTLRVIAETDWVYQNTTQLLYQFRNVEAVFAGIGAEYTLAWVPGASRDEQAPLQRVALLGAYAYELNERTVLQTALLAGGYPTGDPIDRTRPYVLTAVTVVMRY